MISAAAFNYALLLDAWKSQRHRLALTSVVACPRLWARGLCPSVSR
ncbi:hypothetical protein KCP73_20505 [Salmonella enterica subsp. enterica]|nr:hypothetical protein KCP73_20505 [Salmonella enterica subsp. enterica]